MSKLAIDVHEFVTDSTRFKYVCRYVPGHDTDVFEAILVHSHSIIDGKMEWVFDSGMTNLKMVSRLDMIYNSMCHDIDRENKYAVISRMMTLTDCKHYIEIRDIDFVRRTYLLYRVTVNVDVQKLIWGTLDMYCIVFLVSQSAIIGENVVLDCTDRALSEYRLYYIDE